MVFIETASQRAERASAGEGVRDPRPSPLSSPLPTSEPQLPQLSPEGTRAARGTRAPPAGRGSTERPGTPGRAPPPARPRLARAAQNREALRRRRSRRGRCAVAAARPAAGRAGRHGGRRAPRLRAQDQQVERPSGPLPGRPHVSEPRPGAAQPSPAWAPLIQAPWVFARSARFLRPGGRRRGEVGRAAGVGTGGHVGAAGAMVAEVRPRNRWDAWGCVRGPSWRRWLPRLLTSSWPIPGPRTPGRGSWGALSIPSVPGVGRECTRRRNLGPGIAFLAALESPQEVSRALLPARVPCPVVWGGWGGGEGDSCGCPPAPSPASGSPSTAWTRWRWMGD